MKSDVRNMKYQLNQCCEKMKTYFLSDKRTFALGFCFDKLFLIFMIGSMVGTYYEQILNLVKYYLENGTIFWEFRRGVIYGPFNPLYGFGAIVMILCLAKKKRPWYKTLGYGMILGGVVEYTFSWLQETFVGTTSWDYTGYFLNIGGRTTIPFMIAWGVMGLIFADIVYPFISNLIEKIPYLLGKWMTVILVIFMSLNMFISWTALFRQTLRREGVEPYTSVGKFYDKVYTDEVLNRYYPNMRASKKKK